MPAPRPGRKPLRTRRVLPFVSPQPHPLSTHVIVQERPAATAIARVFRPADVSRCRLCPTCMASPEGMCLVMAGRHVPDHEAPLYLFDSPPPGDPK